jgi:nitrite reductase (NADH) large subunit
LLDNPDETARLAARFRFSQQFSQDDPWAKRVEGDRRDLHSHLGTIVLREKEPA